MAGSIKASSVSALTNAVRAAWLTSFNAAQDNLPWRDLVTDMGKSNHATQNIDWLGETPEMQDATREDLHIGALNRYSYSITHKVYKAALKVRLADLETDNQNQIPPRVAGLAKRAAGHPGRLSFDQLEANPTAFDATALFANTRAYGAAANTDNLLAGTGTTAANIETDIQTLRTTMMRFQDDTGEEMELSPNVLIIPPDLGLKFSKVLGGTRDPGGTTLQTGVIPPTMGNKWSAGGYTVYELARLSDTDNWYGLHTGEELNPFIYSWIAQPAIMNRPSVDDASAVESDMLIYAVRGHYNVGVSLPMYFCSVVN